MKDFQYFFHFVVEKKKDLQDFPRESLSKSRCGFFIKMFSGCLPQFSFYQMLMTPVQPPAHSRENYEAAIQMQGNTNTSYD